ncbi:MAG TPA: hypothetical protein VIH99_14175 [Bdellovibrionota bacterium]|jgi:hypothetical protein
MMMYPEARKSKRFRLHSIAVEIAGDGSEQLVRDFDFFTDRPEAGVEARYTVSLEVEARDPRPTDLPKRAADRVFPDCVLYREGNFLVYEYAGTVLRVERGKNSSSGCLISANATLAQEIGYLFLQSEIGRFLDAQGLHRVHALGLGLPDGSAALVLLPSGGGKSTLAAQALESENCRLLSDDSPLVDRFGNVHPYPLRLSFRPDAKLPPLWKEQATVFERRRHGKKLLVPTAALPSSSLPRPGEKFRPGYLILARRHGQRAEPELNPLSRWQGVTPLLRDLVVGLGIPQVAELILTKGARSLPGLAPTAASRLAAATAFLARAKPMRLELGRDSKSNARFLLEQLAAKERP